MFDVGFSELLVIAVVALLVLGPERLPKAARFAGLWVRRARAHWNSVKAEFVNELASEDLQRTLRETREALANAESQLRGGAAQMPRALCRSLAGRERRLGRGAADRRMAHRLCRRRRGSRRR